MKSIRGGSGLGDSLYVQAIARHLLRRGERRLQVCSDYPDLFKPLADKVEVVPHRRIGVDIHATYTMRKHCADTDQFRDCCISAGIREPVELRIEWQSDKAIESNKPIVCVQLPRLPMGRTDGFGADVMPDCGAIQRIIDRLADRVTLVQIGKGEPTYRFNGIDMDFANQTSVEGMMDIAACAAGFIGFCSFMVPLAESLGRPGLFVWSSKSRTSKDLFVRQITPRKVLHSRQSSAIYDNEPAARLDAVADSFLR